MRKGRLLLALGWAISMCVAVLASIWAASSFPDQPIARVGIGFGAGIVAFVVFGFVVTKLGH